MKLIFKKFKLLGNVYGLAKEGKETEDKIFVDFSKCTVMETIKGEKQEILWPYSSIKSTHLKGVYALSVGEKDCFNDWYFKPKGIKKLFVWYYKNKNAVISSVMSNILRNIFF